SNSAWANSLEFCIGCYGGRWTASDVANWTVPLPSNYDFWTPAVLMFGSAIHLYGSDGLRLYEFRTVQLNSSSDWDWEVTDITAQSDVSECAGLVTPAALLTGGDTVHVFVARPDGHLVEFYKEPDPAPWRAYDHTLDVGGATAVGRPAVLLTGGDTVHIFAR